MPGKPQVYLIDSEVSPVSREAGLEMEILCDEAELVFFLSKDPYSLPSDALDADALIVSRFPQLSQELLESFKKVQMIVRNGVGYDNIDADAAYRLGIPVCNVPDYGTEEVADFAILLTLALQRKLHQAVADVRDGNWSWRVAEPGRRLRGQRFGILGCGRIGTATALRAKALGFSVQFHDPYVSNGYEKAIGVARCATLDELLQTSDVVSLHCPLTVETRGIMGRSQLRSMKHGAFLVNTARGPMIPEAELIAVLRTGHLGGVALDVLDNEPVCSPELFNFPNCLITPHLAFYSADSVAEMRASAARNVLRHLQGFGAINIVNGVAPNRRES